MNISTKLLVSNSDMIKNYKSCREKAEDYGKIFILRNNQPDAVLYSITEYERLSSFIECLENFGEDDIGNVIISLQEKEWQGYSNNILFISFDRYSLDNVLQLSVKKQKTNMILIIKNKIYWKR